MRHILLPATTGKQRHGDLWHSTRTFTTPLFGISGLPTITSVKLNCEFRNSRRQQAPRQSPGMSHHAHFLSAVTLLRNMVELTSLIAEDAAEVLSDETRGYLDYLKNASVELQSYVG